MQVKPGSNLVPAMVILIAVAILLTGCTGQDSLPPGKDSSPGVHGNPASSYCESLGCRSEIRTGSDGGQYGVCILQNGTEVDEWDYFRSSLKEE